MKKYLYIANISSPHIAEWMELLEEGDELNVATIERTSLDMGDRKFRYLGAITPPKLLDRLPKIVRYFALGIILRRRDFSGWVVHVHNASGYGLCGILSGHRYMLTTYGSEIYSAPASSFMYRYLIRKVLTSAFAVTASTAYMKSFIAQHWPEVDERVFAFSLGVKAVFENAPKMSTSFNNLPRPIWFSNRRMLPLYRILEIVQAFKKFKANGGAGTLILLEGDSGREYAEKIRMSVANRDDIKIVSGFVDAHEIIGLLDAADFSISVPQSDQLSSSILESMSRSCIPILSDLDAYKTLSDACVIVDGHDDFSSSMEQAFWKSSAMSYSAREDFAAIGRRIIVETHSKNRAADVYRSITETRTEVHED